MSFEPQILFSLRYHAYSDPGLYALWNPSAISVLLIGMFGAITTTRLVICTALGVTEQVRWRYVAIWPALMLCVFYAVSAHGYMRSAIFAQGVVAAFGLAFAIANLRAPSRYSKNLGGIFALIYGCLTLVALTDAWSFFQRMMRETELAAF